MLSSLSVYTFGVNIPSRNEIVQTYPVARILGYDSTRTTHLAWLQSKPNQSVSANEYGPRYVFEKPE